MHDSGKANNTEALAKPSMAVPRLLSVGDAAWTVEFGNAIDSAIHQRVLGYCEMLEAERAAGRLSGIVEWVPTFRSVTVHFNPEQIDAECLGSLLLEMASHRTEFATHGCRWYLPVCFDEDYAPDLVDVVMAKGLKREAVITLMTETVFSVYMLGFLPGFPYFGGLPAALDMPRLATPRKLVPARSIAVAGRMCSAYPWASPGGWRLLGRTPIGLFDVRNEQRPALLAPGDEVVWRAIDRDTFSRLESRCASGPFDVDCLLNDGGWQ